jgi:hypothetical protein
MQFRQRCDFGGMSRRYGSERRNVMDGLSSYNALYSTAKRPKLGGILCLGVLLKLRQPGLKRLCHPSFRNPSSGSHPHRYTRVTPTA